MNRTSPTLAALGAVLLLAAGCADDGADDVETPTDTEDSEDAEEVAEDDPAEDAATAEDDDGTADDDRAADDDGAAGSAVEVASAGSELGDVLVDGEGLTLYLFDPDEQGPSTCYDECEDNWPPLLSEEAPEAGGDADPDLLGTVERDDGSMQVTYDGWPLYHWVGDDEPGDVNGQGVQEVWWVVEPDGTPVRDDPGGPAEDEEDDAGGY